MCGPGLSEVRHALLHWLIGELSGNRWAEIIVGQRRNLRFPIRTGQVFLSRSIPTGPAKLMASSDSPLSWLTEMPIVLSAWARRIALTRGGDELNLTQYFAQHTAD